MTVEWEKEHARLRARILGIILVPRRPVTLDEHQKTLRAIEALLIDAPPPKAPPSCLTRECEFNEAGTCRGNYEACLHFKATPPPDAPEETTNLQHKIGMIREAWDVIGDWMETSMPTNTSLFSAFHTMKNLLRRTSKCHLT